MSTFITLGENCTKVEVKKFKKFSLYIYKIEE
jgi:hypothetical protein